MLIMLIVDVKLPLYFNDMKPALPRLDDCQDIKLLIFLYFPKLAQEFSEQQI